MAEYKRRYIKYFEGVPPIDICIELSLLFRKLKKFADEKTIGVLPFEGCVRDLCFHYKVSEANLRVKLRTAYITPFEEQMTMLRKIGYTSQWVNELRAQYYGQYNVEYGIAR